MTFSESRLLCTINTLQSRLMLCIRLQAEMRGIAVRVPSKVRNCAIAHCNHTLCAVNSLLSALETL